MQLGPGPAAQRVFVALWPPDSVREALAAVVQRLAMQYPAARAMQARNLHLTLAFIGSLATPRVQAVAQAIASLPPSSFDWRLDRLGAFAKARVLWAGGEPSAPLADLAGHVRDLLDRMHVRYDTKPFAAHVTLLRDVPRAVVGSPPIEAPIDWHVTGATLVRSVSCAGGLIYRPFSVVDAL